MHAPVTLIVPVFNEAENFPRLIEAIERDVTVPYRLLVVYDFDGDTTVPVARQLAQTRPWLQLVRNDLGRGPANAIRAGFQAAAHGPAVVVMADLSDDLSQLPAMLEQYAAGYRVVCPSRYMRGGRQEGGGRLKSLMSRTAGLSLCWLAGFPTHDATNNFRLYDAALVNQLGIDSQRGFEIALELTAKAYARGAPITELPTTWRDRTTGQSNFKIVQWLPLYLRWYFFALFAGWRRWGLLPLLAICLAFVTLRLPIAVRQIPAQDEDYFAVPGLTILRQGIPRIPYMPSRNPQGAFYKADEMLFALPPLYFYLEAAMYAVAGPSTGAARSVSLLCGLAAIVAVHILATRLFRTRAAGLWSAGLYAASRVIYFPAMIARPDMLCGALGLGVLIGMHHWGVCQRKRWLLCAGVGIGFGMLSHPFAMVYALQSGVWALLVRGRLVERIGRAALLTAVAVATFALWGVLIVQHPEAFQGQFFNNVLNQSGPGLLSRMVWPVRSFGVQLPLFTEYAGSLQAAVMTGGLLAAIVIAVRTADPAFRMAAVLAGSAVYLHVATVGVHPTKGYWCYTGALVFVCLGGVISRFLQTPVNTCVTSAIVSSHPNAHRRLRTVATVAGAAAIMLPGAGLRTVVAHVRHWDDVNYDAPRFTQELIEAVPADAKLVVDPGYIFGFYRAGRTVALALDYEFFFSVRGTEYDYLVAGPYSIRDRVPEALNGRFVREFGDKQDLFACYAEIYAAPGRE